MGGELIIYYFLLRLRVHSISDRKLLHMLPPTMLIEADWGWFTEYLCKINFHPFQITS